MPTRAAANCVAVHIRFPFTVNSVSTLRHVYQQFQHLGDLVHWTDYLSKAGYAHHSSRSMAVFLIDKTLNDDNSKWKRYQLEKELKSIVGVPLYSD